MSGNEVSAFEHTQRQATPGKYSALFILLSHGQHFRNAEYSSPEPRLPNHYVHGHKIATVPSGFNKACLETVLRVCRARKTARQTSSYTGAMSPKSLCLV